MLKSLSHRFRWWSTPPLLEHISYVSLPPPSVHFPNTISHSFSTDSTTSPPPRKQTPRKQPPAAISPKEFEMKLLPSLILYKQIHGHFFMQSNFCVKTQSHPLWATAPTNLRNYPMGARIVVLRRGVKRNQFSPEQVAQLKAIEFPFDRVKQKFDEMILQNARIYFQVHGSLATIDQEFVIPELPPWPEPFRGYKFGKAIHRIRGGVYMKNQVQLHEQELIQLGVLKEYNWNDTIKRALPNTLDGLSFEKLS